MKLSTIKNHLKELNTIAFRLPDGSLVPEHFHVTEVGEITKNFIDCGGTLRSEKVVNFQLWDSDDYNHRLHPEKLLSIIELSQQKLDIGDLEIEVEYQGESIMKFGLDIEDNQFVLTTKHTDCLAKENCVIPLNKQKLNPIDLSEMIGINSCSPGSGCC